jgi:regulator of protease activity HflC (stomatin/prohibitin superfamily)
MSELPEAIPSPLLRNPIDATLERPTWSANGLLVLLLVFLIAVFAAWRLIDFIDSSGDAARVPPFLWTFIPAVLIVSFLSIGFYMIQPNQAAAILLFGSYQGTDRKAGLRWVWPWLTKTKISVRTINTTSEKLKVNDLGGSPIEIASNVVWRVADTGQALFDIDDYREFVDIQIEAAVRSIGSRYPYDDNDLSPVTLRGGHEQVADELRIELNERLKVAGITVDECGLTHLAYAPEIAGAMLRRQQAEAVIAARIKLVEGAVSMVEMALEQLSEKNVVELDDERRAAMVSNLMVVLCGDRDTQPVVNAGSLYQ